MKRPRSRADFNRAIHRIAAWSFPVAALCSFHNKVPQAGPLEANASSENCRAV
jgi:hypothetical protein